MQGGAVPCAISVKTSQDHCGSGWDGSPGHQIAPWDNDTPVVTQNHDRASRGESELHQNPD